MHEKTVAMMDRTKRFALRIIRLVDQLFKSRSADVLGRQILRSATSVGANDPAAQRERSKAEFIAKLGIVEEEADETCDWLELITESKLVKPERLSVLLQEAQEILAISVTSIRSARSRSTKSCVPHPQFALRFPISPAVRFSHLRRAASRPLRSST